MEKPTRGRPIWTWRDGLPPTNKPIQIKSAADLMAVFEAHRIDQGMTVHYVAKKAGYNTEAYRKWNHRERPSTPSISAVMDVAEVLGLRVVLVPKEKKDV